MQRQTCINKLKCCSYYLKDLAGATIAVMKLSKTDEDQETALLGLKCHHKSTEPFFSTVSYVDGGKYDFSGKKESAVGDAVDDTNDKRTDNKKNEDERMLFTCTDNCIHLTEDELGRLIDLLEKAASCPSEKAEDWMREFVETHTKCSVSLPSGRNDIYMFPCVQRNHPGECYVVGEAGCTSSEVLLRKGIVHYENLRKLHSILQEATKAHKLLADIDAATVLDDLQYLAKLVRIKLGSPPGIGRLGDGPARRMTSDSIEEVLRGEHRDKYDEVRQDNLLHKCVSCFTLKTTKQITKINVDTWKVFKQRDRLNMSHAYMQLGEFLLEHNLLDVEEEVDEALDEEILREYEENLSENEGKLHIQII